MGSLASGQHLDKLADALRAGFGLLGTSDPVENGVSIRTRERLEHLFCSRIGTEGNGEILRHLNAGLPGVGVLPSTVLFRPAHLDFAGSMHSTGGDQPLSDGSVPLRPRTARPSRRKAPSIRDGVTAPQLSINPAEADRLGKRLVVRDGGRLDRSLFRHHQPDSRRIGMMVAQPPSPFVSVPNQKLWKIHGVHRIPMCAMECHHRVGGATHKDLRPGTGGQHISRSVA